MLKKSRKAYESIFHTHHIPQLFQMLQYKASHHESVFLRAEKYTHTNSANLVTALLCLMSA